MFIRKRNDDLVEFDKAKVINAINRAFLEVDGQIYESDIADEIADEIEKYCSNKTKSVSVEEIQDLIEEKLMVSERQDVARAYIRFRYKKEVARKYTNDFIQEIRKKLSASDVQNQNANVDEYSFGGRTGEASSVVTKQLAIDYLLSDKAKYNHLNNRIYIHDLDAYCVGSHNCLSIPFDDLLAKGFNTRQTDVRPAKTISTAFQLVAVIFQLQSLQQFGGVSATHLDWTMVPYVRRSFYKHLEDGLKYIDHVDNLKFIDQNGKEVKLTSNDWSSEKTGIERERFGCSDQAYQYAMDMTKREIHQAVEGMYHNLNYQGD